MMPAIEKIGIATPDILGARYEFMI